MASTLLVPDTSTMEDRRRIIEQDGHRRSWHARMNVRDRPEDSAAIAPGPEEAPANGIAEHPLLNTPRYDGIDPDLNPLPPLNTEARTEMENELRLQNQKKLEKMNQPTSTPTPKLRR